MATKTLLLTGGEIHDWRGCGDEIEGVLAGSPAFALTRVNDCLSALEAPNLEPYELLVFYYTVGEISTAQKTGLLEWLAKGRGYVGIHSAADSFRGCPEYRHMVGGWFVTHPHYRQYQVSVADREHPITAGLEEFMVEDEQYILDYDPRVHVLASALWRGQAMPVAWTKTWGEAGRVFYLALGHDPHACRNEHFKLLLERGALWAGTKP